jgi:hypothetical protein
MPSSAHPMYQGLLNPESVSVDALTLNCVDQLVGLGKRGNLNLNKNRLSLHSHGL